MGCRHGARVAGAARPFERSSSTVSLLFPLVGNISLPIAEPYGCLTPTADVRITSLLQRLGLPTMTKSYSTSTRTIGTHLGLFLGASSFTRAEFHMPCSWIYQWGETW